MDVPVRHLEPGEGGASPLAKRPLRMRMHWKQAHAEALAIAVRARGVDAAGAEFAISRRRVYSVLQAFDLPCEPPTALELEAERTATPAGTAAPPIHEGTVEPVKGSRAQIGRLLLPCPNCRAQLALTTVLRDAADTR